MQKQPVTAWDFLTNMIKVFWWHSIIMTYSNLSHYCHQFFKPLFGFKFNSNIHFIFMNLECHIKSGSNVNGIRIIGNDFNVHIEIYFITSSCCIFNTVLEVTKAWAIIISSWNWLPMVSLMISHKGHGDKGKHPESGGARREIICWHQAEDSDTWCQQVISRLAPPDERVFSFYTVLTYGINNKWCQ